MSKLKPCPLCGGGAQTFGSSLSGFYTACTNLDCCCSVGEAYDKDAMPDHQFATEALAEAAWNRRAEKAEIIKCECGNMAEHHYCSECVDHAEI